MEIKVGIKTDGEPIIKSFNGYSLVRNMLIGDGFHWQQVIEANLPGEVFINKNEGDDREDKVRLVNVLPLEKYLECVVGSEMNPEAPVEFLKAHAVISRSWALGKILDIHPKGNFDFRNSEKELIGWDDTASHKGFHVCSDDHCQRYQGLQPIPEKTLQAIKETRDEVIVSKEGNVIDARFSKCCGGETELFETCWQNIKPDCLENFKDPWCDLRNLSSLGRRSLLSSILKDYDLETKGYGFSWKVLVSKKDIKRNLKEKFGKNIGDVRGIEVLHRGPSGRIELLRIHGSEGFLDLGKELWIRRVLSSSHLYSSAFDIEDLGDSFRLTGKGWGHGVGLCQIGAANMANNGKSYSEILSFYYPGSTLSKITNSISN